jgi:hypothetical protein
MVGAPGSLAPAPPMGPVVDVFYDNGGVPSMFLCVDGGRSRISGTASQGAHRRRPATKW